MWEIDNIEVKATEKVIDAVKKSSFDALLLFGYDNVQYAGGAFLPFLPYRRDMHVALFVSKFGECIYICPSELASSIRNLGRVNRIFSYSTDGYKNNNFIKAIKSVAVTSKTIGIDFDRISHSLFAKLDEELSDVKIEKADSLLEALREVKCESEINLLSEIAYATDHGINGTLHHVLGNFPKPMFTIAEQMRLHLMERGFHSGYNAVTRASGHDGNNIHYPVCKKYGYNYGFSPVERLNNTDMIRLHAEVVSGGYWSNSARIMHYKPATEAQKKIYSNWFTVRNFMVSIIKPGIKCSEIFEKTTEFAKEQGIELDPVTVLGHSVGVSPMEKPFFEKDDDTEIKTGMVLVISPAVLDGKESLQSNDTIEVLDNGVKVLNWWKDWREPYFAIPELP